MSRELLIEALKRQACFNVVDSVTTSQEAIKVACSSNVDVALISATLADGPLSGFGALRRPAASITTRRKKSPHTCWRTCHLADSKICDAATLFCCMTAAAIEQRRFVLCP